MSLQELLHPCQLCGYGYLVNPCVTASSRWSRIRVSASSWVHGARPYMSRGKSVWYVLTTCLSVTMVAALVARKEITRGGGYIPLSLFVLQPSSYLPDVNPTQLICSHITVVMRNMLTIAAPSRMTTCTTGVGELSCTGTRSSKQPPRSVFFTFIRCCHFTCFVVQRYQALDMIFGLFMRSCP